MSVKLLVEIQPDGDRCGECNKVGEYKQCLVFGGYPPIDEDPNGRIIYYRLPACHAAEKAEQGAGREEGK